MEKKVVGYSAAGGDGICSVTVGVGGGRRAENLIMWRVVNIVVAGVAKGGIVSMGAERGGWRMQKEVSRSDVFIGVMIWGLLLGIRTQMLPLVGSAKVCQQR